MTRHPPSRFASAFARRDPRRVALGVALALSVAAVGCHRKVVPPPHFVSRITVSEATLADNPALRMDAAALKDRVVLALDATGRFSPLDKSSGAPRPAADPKRPAFRCRAEVTFTRESDEEAPPTRSLADGGSPLRRAEVGITVTLSPSSGEGDPIREEASAVRLFDPAAKPVPGGSVDARTQAFRAALDAALQSAANGLLLELDAADKSDVQLIADLSSADRGLRDCAVRQLADRRNPAAVPALIERLKDSDRPLVLRAMGALEALRDRRAVKPLIDLTERQDPAFVTQVVYVLGALGGSDAEAFLYTLENGSPDPQVRAAAAEAAAELRQRRKVAASAEAARPKGPSLPAEAAGSASRGPKAAGPKPPGEAPNAGPASKE